MDTLGDFSLKILNSQINDINNNLVKIANDDNSMESDGLEFSDYEYILTSRKKDSENLKINSKLNEKKNLLSQPEEIAKVTQSKVKSENRPNEILLKFKKSDVDQVNDLSISSLSIPSDISIENLKDGNKNVNIKHNRKKENDLILKNSSDANDFKSLKITFV